MFYQISVQRYEIFLIYANKIYILKEFAQFWKWVRIKCSNVVLLKRICTRPVACLPRNLGSTVNRVKLGNETMGDQTSPRND